MYSWFVLHQVLEPFRVDSPVDNYGEENRLRETWVEAWPATGKPKPSPRGSPESARPRRCSSRHCPAPPPARREAPSAPPPPRTRRTFLPGPSSERQSSAESEYRV